jgi:hypothetical protein
MIGIRSLKFKMPNMTIHLRSPFCKWHTLIRPIANSELTLQPSEAAGKK